LNPLRVTYNPSDKAFTVFYVKDNNSIVIINDKLMLVYGQNMIIFPGDKLKIYDLTYRFEMSVL